MKRREVWGAALALAAALIGWGAESLAGAAAAAAGQSLILFVAVPVASVGAWLRVLALLVGAAGLVLLVPALLRRIRRRKLRLATAWTTGLAAAAAVPYLALFLFFAILAAAMASAYVKVDAPGGQSVLITQDHFDGDSVDIYTRHDDTHYRRNRSAPELAGWPRVEDQNCSLVAVGDELQLSCSSGTVVISQGR